MLHRHRLDLVLQLSHVTQLLVPTTLEFSSHQPVVRIDRIVLPPSEVRLIDLMSVSGPGDPGRAEALGTSLSVFAASA